jgi:hypothetical protein
VTGRCGSTSAETCMSSYLRPSIANSRRSGPANEALATLSA